MTPEWITKAHAAAILDCDERTIERRARAGRIASRAKPGRPTLYRAEDVEGLRLGTPPEVRTGILEPLPSVNGNGHGAIAALRPPPPTFEDAVVALLQRVDRVFATGATGPTHTPTGPTLPTLFLTVSEASAVSGLSQAYLRRLIREGLLIAIRDRGWKIRRRDLEGL